MGLRTWHCHCCGLGHCHGADSVPGLGTFAYSGHGQKKKRQGKEKKEKKGKGTAHLLGSEQRK